MSEEQDRQQDLSAWERFKQGWRGADDSEVEAWREELDAQMPEKEEQKAAIRRERDEYRTHLDQKRAEEDRPKMERRAAKIRAREARDAQRWLASKKDLRRHQIAHHKRAFLGDDALLSEVKRRGWIGEGNFMVEEEAG